MDDSEIELVEKKKRSLKKYKKNKALIMRLEHKLFLLEERIVSISSPAVSDMPRGGIPVTIEDLITDKIELEQRIKRLKDKGRMLKNNITAEIDTLEDVREADVLELFMIDGLSFEDIAETEGYNIRHVFRLYSRAIKNLALSEQ